MKRIKIEGLVILAAMALMASVAPGNASATALEIEGWAEDESVTIEASLKSGTSTLLKTTGGLFANTCTESSLKGDTESPFIGTTVTGAVDSFSFTSCTNSVTVHKAGTLHVQQISSTTNGTVSWSGAEVTVGSPFGTLNCKPGAGVDIGTLTGSKEGTALLDISAVLNCGFLLPSAKWEATYVVTSPVGLGVAQDANLDHYFAGVDPAVFKGEKAEGQKSEWVVQGSPATCTTVKYESPSTTVRAKTIKLAPAFSTCTNFGWEGTIDAKGCEFQLLRPKTVTKVPESNVAIRCESGKLIKLTSAKAGEGECRVIVEENPTNVDLAKNQYANLGSPAEKFETKFELTGIKAEVTESSGKCPLKKGLVNNVTYTAQVNIEAEKNAWIAP